MKPRLTLAAVLLALGLASFNTLVLFIVFILTSNTWDTEPVIAAKAWGGQLAALAPTARVVLGQKAVRAAMKELFSRWSEML